MNVPDFFEIMRATLRNRGMPDDLHPLKEIREVATEIEALANVDNEKIVRLLSDKMSGWECDFRRKDPDGASLSLKSYGIGG